MKAIRIEAFGDVEGLRAVELPDPAVTPGTALVRVEAASINPSDVKNVQGVIKQTTLPRVPGRDYAGVVEAEPAEWIGVEAWGTGGDVGFTRDGTHAQKIVVPVASLRRKPARLSFDEAASIGVTFMAAWGGTVEAAELQPGETLAVIGAGGGVGSAVAQIARRRGARVIGIDRREPAPDAPIRALAESLIIGASDLAAALIRRLGVKDDDSAEREEDEARLRAAEAGLNRLEALAAEEWTPPEAIEDLRGHYTRRLRRLRARADGKPDGRHETLLQRNRRLQQELLEAEHNTVIALRDQGVINDDVLHKIERDLDLERVRYGRDMEKSAE